MKMRTDSLKPHLTNEFVYNDSADEKLINSIREMGIIQPIVVTRDGIIISGHRRYSAAIQLEMEFVPVVVSELTDRFDVLEAMIEANRQRVKTREQIVKEIDLLNSIEVERGIQEREMNLKNKELGAQNGRSNIRANSALESHPLESTGPVLSGENGGLHGNGISGKGSVRVAKMVGVGRVSVEKTTRTSRIVGELKDAGRLEDAEYIRRLQYTTNPTYAEREAIKKIDDNEFHRRAKESVNSIRDRRVQTPAIKTDVSIETNLRPCSFCGCADISVIQGVVSCDGCGLTAQWDDDTDNERATRKWNRRIP